MHNLPPTPHQHTHTLSLAPADPLASLPPTEDSPSSLSLDNEDYNLSSPRPPSTAQQLTELATQYKEELQQKDEEV